MRVVDTIGAGDSHAGGVLAGLASGLPPADVVLLDNAVAPWVIGYRDGDCVPTHKELLLAYRNIQVATTVADAVLDGSLLLVEHHPLDHQHRYFAI